MLTKSLLVAALIGGLVPAALAQLSSSDKTFAMNAAKANNYELKAAQMAQSMSSNDSYKTYAQMIVTDHTKAGQDLASIIGTADSSVQLPTGVSATGQKHLDTLQNSGKAFDVKYRDQMISTHVAAIQMFKTYIAHPHDNAQLRHFAQEAVPVFEKHLREARKLPKR